MPAELQTLAAYLAGGVLAASAVTAIGLHYYALKARTHFGRAEARIKHAKKMLAEADELVRHARKRLHAKATIHQAEARISKAIADLLTAKEEEEKAISRSRRR